MSCFVEKKQQNPKIFSLLFRKPALNHIRKAGTREVWAFLLKKEILLAYRLILSAVMHMRIFQTSLKYTVLLTSKRVKGQFSHHHKQPFVYTPLESRGGHTGGFFCPKMAGNHLQYRVVIPEGVFMFLCSEPWIIDYVY